MLHPNGHGYIADQAEARPPAFVDSQSRVLDHARVHSGRIIASVVGLGCRVYGATLQNSVVVCDEVVGATVVSSGLFDGSAVWDRAYVEFAELTDGCRVYGDARIIGTRERTVRLWGDMRVLTGTFHRSPRYEHLGFCFLTEGPPGHALVDCKFNSYVGWFRVGERFARRHYGWTAEKLDEVRQVFTEWSATEDLRGKHWGRCVDACRAHGQGLAYPASVLASGPVYSEPLR